MKRLVFFFCAALLSSCTTTDTAYLDAWSDLFIRTNYRATDVMLNSVKSGDRALPDNAAIMVAAVVNIDALDETSKLGRTISGQVLARLTQRGYAVTEFRLPGPALARNDRNDVVLVSAVQEARKAYHAEAVVFGTYAVAKDYVYVHLKMVDASGFSIGADDYALPLDRNVRAMLKNPG